MKEITVQDCLELKKNFDQYCKTAEQHEFPMLAIVNIKMDTTIEKVKVDGKVKNQKDIRAMFRVVLKLIGQYFSEYIEKEGDDK